MPISSNPLQDMADLNSDVVLAEERPNPTFTATALPGFKKSVKSRRAVRVFDGVAIPEDVMRDCLKDATLAPSASNLQTYELYWLRNQEKKNAVAALCLGQSPATTAGDLVVVVSRVDNWKTNWEKLIALMTDDGNKELPAAVHEYYHRIVPMLMRNDPFGIHNLIRRVLFWFKGLSEPMVREPVRRGDHRVYGHTQAALAAQTLMLSLSAHGYESCPMSGIDKKGIGRLIGLPAGAEVSMVIAAGTGKPEGVFSERLRLPYEQLVKEV